MPRTTQRKAKILKSMTGFILLFLCAFQAAASEIKEVDIATHQLNRTMTINGAKVTLEDELDTLYTDNQLHTVKDKKFFVLLKGFPSRPDNPLSSCGTGQEVYADIYTYSNNQAQRIQRIQISSCWNSLSLRDDGEAFSSIKWNEKGMSFSWYKGTGFLDAQLNLDTDAPELVFMPGTIRADLSSEEERQLMLEHNYQRQLNMGGS